METAASRSSATTEDLARALSRAGVLRAVVALALAGYVLWQPQASAPVLARAIGAYWILDGLITLRVLRFAEALALSRMMLVMRGAIALAAGVIVIALPLGVVFGPWQPGHTMLFILVAAVILTVAGVQIGAGAFDVLIWLSLRRRIPGEWSWVVGGGFSALLALIAASTFAASTVVLARILVVAAVVTALAFIARAVTVGRATGAASALAAHSRKP